nr:MFS transporter [Kibdelosporangium sp. MJ126-NF4]CEL19791.1 putative transmembrane efflux protein [Kibdelosporangium sp. MJ126-NF4]CTQ97016.1 putative transmembrane efflux protein [Kibdelosporangium sp. MJ126-NF4]
MLTAGGLLLLGGRLGDLFGRRRMFVTGVVVFAVASLSSGLATTAGMLVASRFGQGVGEALASPAALSMVALLFSDERERVKAFGIWGAVTGTAATAGVMLSGVVTDLAGWRWLFLVNLPVAAIAVVAAFRPAGESRADGTGRVDVPGAVLVTGGLLAVVDGLLAAAEHEWGSTRVLVSLLGGIGALAAFVVVETRAAHPLVPLRFFANRVRVSANMANVFLAVAMTVFFFLFTLYMQNVLGLSPLRTGLAYLPFCGTCFVGYWISARLMRLAGLRVTLVGGFLVGAAGMLWLGDIPAHGSFVAEVMPATLVLGLGLGTCFPALAVAALHGVTEQDAGIESGVQTTVYQLGGALGLAVFATLALRHERGLAATGMDAATAATGGYRLAFGILAVVFLIGAALSLLTGNAPLPDLRQAVDAALLAHTILA